MNPFRFAVNCLTDRRAALRSARLIARSCYGKIYWTLRPDAPLRYRVSSGRMSMLLDRTDSFTSCFWPGVDHYEPDVRAALLHYLTPGATFIDCGANVGYFSVVAAGVVGLTGRVVAIEANPVTYLSLVRNLELNGIGTAVHCALTAEADEVELFVPSRGGDVYSSLRKGGLVNGDEVSVLKVPARRLDDVVESLGIERVDVVKIDIEGGELDVLRSATRMLRTLRPVVVCEYGTNTWPAFGATSRGLLDLMAECGYGVYTFDVERGRAVPVNDEVWTRPYANLILLPTAGALLH